MDIQKLTAAALSIALAAPLFANETQVQRRVTTQETYQVPNANSGTAGASGTSVQGPSAGVQTPVGGAQVQTGGASGTGSGTAVQGPSAGVQTPAGGVQAQTGAMQAGTQNPPAENPSAQAAPAAVQTPLAQRTYTQEEYTMAQNNPPIRWSVLQGEVTHVDKVNNVVEIRLRGSDAHIGIPVVQNRVGIYKHGDHQYALKDIDPGDDVTIRNLNTAASL